MVIKTNPRSRCQSSRCFPLALHACRVLSACSSDFGIETWLERCASIGSKSATITHTERYSNSAVILSFSSKLTRPAGEGHCVLIISCACLVCACQIRIRSVAFRCSSATCHYCLEVEAFPRLATRLSSSGYGLWGREKSKLTLCVDTVIT
jgi:hypothetical protein